MPTGVASGVKSPEPEVDHLRPFTAEANNKWSFIFTLLPCLHDMDTESIILFYFFRYRKPNIKRQVFDPTASQPPKIMPFFVLRTNLEFTIKVIYSPMNSQVIILKTISKFTLK